MGGFASSRILEVHAERMLNGTFNPGFKIKLHQKDLNLALSAAKALTCRCRTPPWRSRCSRPVRRMAGRNWTTRR